MEISQTEYDRLRSGRAPRNYFKLFASMSLMLLAGMFLLVNWTALKTHLPSLAIPASLPTSAPNAPAAIPWQPPLTNSGTGAGVETGAPALTFDQINATSIAIYHATAAAVDAAGPVPNTDTTGDSAPLVRVQKETPDRLAPPPAGEASVAEPAVTDAFGSKPMEPINPQRDHVCLHGQIWTDTGCHRPTPVQ